jgi:hypothetical protein
VNARPLYFEEFLEQWLLVDGAFDRDLGYEKYLLHLKLCAWVAQKYLLWGDGAGMERWHDAFFTSGKEERRVAGYTLLGVLHPQFLQSWDATGSSVSIDLLDLYQIYFYAAALCALCGDVEDSHLYTRLSKEVREMIQGCFPDVEIENLPEIRIDFHALQAFTSLPTSSEADIKAATQVKTR